MTSRGVWLAWQGENSLPSRRFAVLSVFLLFVMLIDR